MKTAGLCVLIILLLLSTGCTSYFTNLQTPQKTLDLEDSAIFTQESTKFTATITGLSLDGKTNFPRNLQFSMSVKNSGNEAFSLIGYPRLVDADGREYTGTNIMFNTINPGGYSTGKTSIPIRSEEDYNALLENAVLKVRFQSMKPLPYEGIWAVNFSSL